MTRLGAESGQPIDMTRRRSSFMHLIEQTDSCWLWKGTRTSPNGYGRMQVGKRNAVLAHRAVYTALVGPIPDGMVVDHLCRVKLCVNPAHLEVVTQSENTWRDRSTRTHCPQGHAYDEANTYRHPVTGHRACRECGRLSSADYHRNRRKRVA